MLYYLQEGLLTICLTKVSNCVDTKGLEMLRKSCKKILAEILETMKESRAALVLEPVQSSEWKMAMQMSRDSKRMKTLVSFLGLSI